MKTRIGNTEEMSTRNTGVHQSGGYKSIKSNVLIRGILIIVLRFQENTDSVDSFGSVNAHRSCPVNPMYLCRSTSVRELGAPVDRKCSEMGV